MKIKTGLRNLYLQGRTALLGPFVGKLEKISIQTLRSSNRILILTMDRLGDLMCSLPIFKAIRQAAPDADITVCAPSYIKDLLTDHPDINHWCPPEKLQQQAVQLPYDIAIDLATDYPLKSMLLAWRLRSKLRIGYNIAGRGVFLTHPLKYPGAKIHTVDLLAKLLEVFGIDNIDRQPHLEVKASWRKDFENAIKEFPGGQDFAAIHPGGVYPTQRWPSERFAEIGDRLAQAMSAPPLLLGGPAENDLCEEIAAKMSCQPVNLCGNLSIGGLTAAIAQSKILICNNSGPLHVAVAVDTPTLSTMGPTLPETWWPIGSQHTVIRHDLECSPCNEGYCKLGTHECLLSISVDEMWMTLEKIMQFSALSKNNPTGRTIIGN